MDRSRYKALKRFVKQFLPVDDITGKIKPYKIEYVEENMENFYKQAVEILKNERFV